MPRPIFSSETLVTRPTTGSMEGRNEPSLTLRIPGVYIDIPAEGPTRGTSPACVTRTGASGIRRRKEIISYDAPFREFVFPLMA
jgi:hypothetical protein